MMQIATLSVLSNVQTEIPGLFDTVKSLTALGFSGVGVVVFLLIFILLMRGKPIDDASAKLYNRMLTLGVGFAVFCGALTIVTLWLTPAPGNAQDRLIVNVSPSFATRKLTPPVIQLDGQDITPGKEFVWKGQSATIFISVDQALSEVDALKETVKNFSQTTAALTEQRDKLVAALPADTTQPQASDQAKAASTQTSQLSAQVNAAILAGKFSQAAQLSHQITQSATLKPQMIDKFRQVDQ